MNSGANIDTFDGLSHTTKYEKLIDNLYNNLFKNKINYAISEKCWYFFVEHLWIKILDIKEYISLKIQPYSEEIKKFKNDRLINNIIKRFKKFVLFNCVNFDNLLNSNPFLLGFNNGIYDLQKCEFREGRPEDFVSFTTGYSYGRQTFHINDSHEFLKLIFKNQVTVNNFIKTLVLCLTGKPNPEQKIIFLTNELLHEICIDQLKVNKLLEIIFGQYCAILPSSLISNERTSIRKKKKDNILFESIRKRCLIFNGFDTINKLNVPMIKSLCSGEEQCFRGHPLRDTQAKIFITSNYVPNNYDSGMMRRIEDIKFTNDDDISEDNIMIYGQCIMHELLFEHQKLLLEQKLNSKI